jgi:hypothetical protein
MGGQSVIIRAEKGKVKMLVDEAGQEKELVYDARKDINHEDKPTNPQSIRSATEDNGRAVHLERAAHQRPGLPGAVDQPDAVGPMAEPGTVMGTSMLSCFTIHALHDTQFQCHDEQE